MKLCLPYHLLTHQGLIPALALSAFLTAVPAGALSLPFMPKKAETQTEKTVKAEKPVKVKKTAKSDKSVKADKPFDVGRFLPFNKSKNSEQPKKAKKPKKAQRAEADAQGTLPGSKYKLEAVSRTETLNFRVREEGLSENQSKALDQVSARAGWALGQPVSLVLIGTGSPASVHSMQSIQAYLITKGVADEDISLYNNSLQPADVISLNVMTYSMKPLQCGQKWESLTYNYKNEPYNNFGCTITANMAAQIADPRDVIDPAPGDPIDATRRTLVMDKYQKGEITAAAANDDAKPKISQVAQ
jgi:pilus assembly protein CpaD